jgi:RNA polymerase primary sigma factor
MLKDKDLKEVQALIDMGKKRGFVTHEEVSSQLPTHLISSENLEDLMIMLSENDIEVVKLERRRIEAERRGVQPEEKKVSETIPPGAATTPSASTCGTWGR